MRALMNTKMAKKTPLRDHVQKIFDYLNTLQIIGGQIDVESEIDIILGSLPDSFNQFKLNCSMNKIDFTLTELLNALQTMDDIIKCHHNINNVENTSFSSLFPREKATWKRQVENEKSFE